MNGAENGHLKFLKLLDLLALLALVFLAGFTCSIITTSK